MPIKVTCPECDTVLKAPSKLGGKKARCPGCQGVLEVPEKKRKKKKSKKEASEETDVFSALSSAADKAPSASPRTAAGAMAAPKRKKKSPVLAIVLLLLIMGGVGGGVAVLVVSMQDDDTEKIDPESAEGAMTLLARDFDAKKFWAQLPPDYQTKANTVMQSLGRKLGEDKSLYDRGFVALRNLAVAMEEQQGLFQKSELIGSLGFTQAGLINHFKDIPAALDAIAQSNLGQASKLDSFDWGAYLDTEKAINAYGHIAAASNMLANQISLTELKKASVEKVSGGEGQAVVRFTVDDKPPMQMEFATVGGKWLPMKFIDGWNNFFDDMDKRLKEFPEEGGLPPQLKEDVTAWVVDIEILADKIKKAKHVKALEEAIKASKFGPKIEAMRKAAEKAKAAEDEAKAKKAEQKKANEEAETKDGGDDAEKGGSASDTTNPTKPLPGADVPKTKSLDLPGL